LVATWIFATFTGAEAPVVLPGAAFIVSACAYGVLIWVVSGVQPAPALVAAAAGKAGGD
jgi:hypothetical protein